MGTATADGRDRTDATKFSFALNRSLLNVTLPSVKRVSCSCVGSPVDDNAVPVGSLKDSSI